MIKETKLERIIRIFGESAAQAKAEDEAGVEGAYFRWALAIAIQEELIAGGRITDLDCFRLDPRYTGDAPQAELPAEVMTEIQEKGLVSPAGLSEKLFNEDLRKTLVSAPGKRLERQSRKSKSERTDEQI